MKNGIGITLLGSMSSPRPQKRTQSLFITTSEQQGENIAVAEPDPAVVAEQAVFRQEATPEASPNDADNNNNADTDAAVGGNLVEMSTSKQDESFSPPRDVSVQESSQTVTPAAPAPSTKQRSLFASSMLSSLAQKAEVIAQ